MDFLDYLNNFKLDISFFSTIKLFQLEEVLEEEINRRKKEVEND